MRNHHEGVWIIPEIVFQPVPGFEIKMVRGFVQQQEVRLLQQEFGECDPHLPSA